DAALVHPDLQLHHVAARGRADHAGADALVVLVERADVARVLVVIDDLVAVCHVRYLNVPPIGRYSSRSLPCAFPRAATARAAWRSCASGARPCSRLPPRS